MICVPPKPSQNISETRSLASLRHADLFLLAQLYGDCPRSYRFVLDALRLGPPNLYLSRQHLLIPTCATTLLSANASVLISARFSVNADGDGSKKQWHSARLIY